MTVKSLEQGGNSLPSREKLIAAVISLWERVGSAGVSVRAVAGESGLPVSSIYHHFGDLERLSEVAQGEAQRAASGWCESQLDAIGAGAAGGGALGALLATLIDDWCETRRALAFAWRECQLMALRDPRHMASCAQWDALWLRFWREVCARLGIADMGTATAWVFDGASSLHLLRWRRAVDRAALGELCQGWGRWIEGDLAAEAPWHELARRDAARLIAPQPPDDPTADAIATAAAATVARKGVAGLTHRAVAAEAGLTLGVVSYKFRTSADLLHAAFEAIYRRMAPRSEAAESMPGLGPQEALARLDAGVQERSALLAADELLIASARDPAFQAFAAQLRYLRGRTSGGYLRALTGPERAVSPMDAAIFSAFLGGRVRAYASGGWALTPPGLTGDFTALLSRLGWT